MTSPLSRLFLRVFKVICFDTESLGTSEPAPFVAGPASAPAPAAAWGEGGHRMKNAPSKSHRAVCFIAPAVTFATTSSNPAPFYEMQFPRSTKAFLLSCSPSQNIYIATSIYIFRPVIDRNQRVFFIFVMDQGTSSFNCFILHLGFYFYTS